MKWVVKSSPAAVTWEQKNDDFAALQQLYHPTEREVATHLPADRPLLDNNLFVDQSEMIYSMDSNPFISLSHVYDHSCPTPAGHR
ncbi:unnamed protein product [Spirodela intermedia]|uniref:Uncharacterized protein n=1 Tax=Spirodela intermedia TaxID=51605 RepID=A0ABN7ECR9_SPIIN|nr:unnamed protein product [Spirodela intermedia]